MQVLGCLAAKTLIKLRKDQIPAIALTGGRNRGYGHNYLGVLGLFLSAPEAQEEESPSSKAGQHVLVVEAFKDLVNVLYSWGMSSPQRLNLTRDGPPIRTKVSTA